MKKQKLNQLFEAARKQVSPAPPNNFEVRVLREIQREPAGTMKASLFDQLNFLFPRVAVGAVAIVIACTLFEVLADSPDLADSAAQASDQLLFSVNDL